MKIRLKEVFLRLILQLFILQVYMNLVLAKI